MGKLNDVADTTDLREKQQSAGIGSVEIGMRVLDVFARSASAMSLKQVCQALDMAPSKAHRYLVSFVRCGMLTQFGANGLYDLGPAARRIGLTAAGRLDSFAAASKELFWLRDTTGHTVGLSVWGDAGPTMVRWETGSWPLYISIRVGSTLPLRGSAIGNTFLAHLPRLLTESVLKRQQELAGLTDEKGIASSEELEKIRASPSIHLQSAIIAGVDAITAPTFDGEGNLSSVISLLAPHQSLAGAAGIRCRRNVEEAARRVSYELGYAPTP